MSLNQQLSYLIRKEMLRNMCIYCLITCTCIGHIYYIRGNHSCSIRTFNCYLYKSYVCGDNVGRSCMGMCVHIIVVAFFKINDFFYQSWSGRRTRGIVKHVYILAVCTNNVCDVLPCQLNIALDHPCWKMQKDSYVTM